MLQRPLMSGISVRMPPSTGTESTRWSTVYERLSPAQFRIVHLHSWKDSCPVSVFNILFTCSKDSLVGSLETPIMIANIFGTKHHVWIPSPLTWTLHPSSTLFDVWSRAEIHRSSHTVKTVPMSQLVKRSRRLTPSLRRQWTTQWLVQPTMKAPHSILGEQTLQWMRYYWRQCQKSKRFWTTDHLCMSVCTFTTSNRQHLFIFFLYEHLLRCCRMYFFAGKNVEQLEEKVVP